jgi:hypothetical protein
MALDSATGLRYRKTICSEALSVRSAGDRPAWKHPGMDRILDAGLKNKIPKNQNQRRPQAAETLAKPGKGPDRPHTI